MSKNTMNNMRKSSQAGHKSPIPNLKHPTQPAPPRRNPRAFSIPPQSTILNTANGPLGLTHTKTTTQDASNSFHDSQSRHTNTPPKWDGGQSNSIVTSLPQSSQQYTSSSRMPTKLGHPV
ncbi:hypothetical protein B0H67DRAFT_56730 [Lasiosphaeris hirsuta]|uniref:Uncharacterized protein n=1 Tax=Lasiosphaeris hirsuta TaxID=260670 RepID=A0AA40BB33_9PEZI|nr:hypothetical protein B0H67DRAFT_56730 [Lasiosphaeris hirsuta]